MCLSVVITLHPLSPPSAMSTFPSNAQAGPSSPRTSLPDLFLPPQGIFPHPSLQLTYQLPIHLTGPPPITQHLASTQDLLARFHLLPAYDKYVRPFATQYSDDGQIRSTPAPDKGKGKQVDSGITPLQQRTLGGSGPPGADAPDAEDDDAGGGKGERKKKNTYKALIKGIPGPFIIFLGFFFCLVVLHDLGSVLFLYRKTLDEEG